MTPFADDRAILHQHHVLNTVRRHVYAVANPRFEADELVAVVTVQAVPRGKPHHALVVLYYPRHIPLSHAAELVIMSHYALRLGIERSCPTHQ